jgi:glycosyltransferase involved in cell wall biosynthesis
MIDSFEIFTKSFPDSLLYFIGNGEEHEVIIEYIEELGLKSKVQLVGFQDAEIVSYYLNASNIFIMGSYKEGWSTSLVEAVSCGIPACVTDFSSASDIISENISGYVCKNRNEVEFSELMIKCLNLNRDNLPLEKDILRSSVKNLITELLNLWSI